MVKYLWLVFAFLLTVVFVAWLGFASKKELKYQEPPAQEIPEVKPLPSYEGKG